jgi:tetratricopeptide (TPR) repeat protein
MDGLLSGLGTSRIDLKDSETIRQQAQNWLTTLDTMRWAQLTQDQTAEHQRLAGELLLTLARTKLDATYSDPEQREAALAEAGKLLARAKPFLPGSTYAWNSLAEEIDTARGGEVTSAHERTSPVTALDFETLGDSKLCHGQLTTAINAYRHANDLSPGNYSTWLKLGNAYREQLSWEDAERSFSRCIQLRRDLPVGYLHRLVTRLELRDFDGAVRDADRFMELKPDNVAGYFNRALAYRGLRDHQQSERDLTRAIELAELSDFGAEPRFFLLRSELRHALNDREGADADHEHGLNLVPFDEANFLARGMAHLKDKNPKQALQDFRAALKLNRNSVSALKNIAYVLSDFLNDNRQAIKTLKMALQARPTDAELRGSLAVLEAREGNSDSARSAIHQALKTDQTAPTLIRAASVYSLTQNGKKDQDQAIEFLQRALATKPLWARYVQGDPDLKAIHANKQFQELIGAANRLLP